MPGADELYPPVQYDGWWLLLAVAILIALAAGAWIVWALTRPPRARPAAPAAPLGAQLDALRERYLAQIARVEGAYGDGDLSARDANAELSRLTRAFVNEYTGVETPVLPLDELAARGASPDLIDALRRHYYPSLFRRGAPVDPAAGADAARKVVTGWH
ncbi:hypothetical protein [Microbacterium karelineae]|uniref:hypothetical protein n=1 Tax=Microbacterium karelineae TaxID=2654283 RepID=UPI0012EA896D|nr:hypothetical protein [Microbacterium karelineae]